MHALGRRGGGVVQTKCDDHNVDTDVETFWLTFSPRTKCCKNKYIGLGYAMLNTKYAQINISKGITQCVHREYIGTVIQPNVVSKSLICFHGYYVQFLASSHHNQIINICTTL